MSSGSDRKKQHDDHLGTLHFNLNRENNDDWVTIHHDDLIQESKKLKLDTEPHKIRRIQVYETPLSSVQLSAKFLFHSFTIMETDSWYYSIETSKMNITMQRAKDKRLLLENFEDEKRPHTLLRSGPKCVRDASGKGTIHDLLQYLYDRNRLNLQYHLLVENCKDLAKWLFDKFNSEGKIYDLTFTSY